MPKVYLATFYLDDEGVRMKHFPRAHGGARVLEDGKNIALYVDGDPREVAECTFSRKVGFGVPVKTIQTPRRRIQKHEDKVDSDSP